MKLERLICIKKKGDRQGKDTNVVIRVRISEGLCPSEGAFASGFTGKAGEHLVCSELFFRGFNASIMSVDVGMDIVAVKENQLFGIQVKISNLNSFDTYVFDIRNPLTLCLPTRYRLYMIGLRKYFLSQ